jgi:hypothetical protein
MRRAKKRRPQTSAINSSRRLELKINQVNKILSDKGWTLIELKHYKNYIENISKSNLTAQKIAEEMEKIR